MLALYAYDPALWVVYNVGKKTASASLQLSGTDLAKKYVDALSGKKLAAQKDGDDLQLKFTLKPFEMLAIRPA
jgi:hypothetical protein